MQNLESIHNLEPSQNPESRSRIKNPRRMQIKNQCRMQNLDQCIRHQLLLFDANNNKQKTVRQSLSGWTLQVKHSTQWYSIDCSSRCLALATNFSFKCSWSRRFHEAHAALSFARSTPKWSVAWPTTTSFSFIVAEQKILAMATSYFHNDAAHLKRLTTQYPNPNWPVPIS